MESPRELIIEYLRGELEGDEKQAFEELLAKDADLKKEVDKQKNLWDLFGKLPDVEASQRLKESTLHAVKHYKNKSIKIRLFRLQDKLDQHKKKESRRLFAPVSAAAAILIIAAVIITILLSETNQLSDNKAKVAYNIESDKYANSEAPEIVSDADEPTMMDKKAEGSDSIMDNEADPSEELKEEKINISNASPYPAEARLRRSNFMGFRGSGNGVTPPGDPGDSGYTDSLNKDKAEENGDFDDEVKAERMEKSKFRERSTSNVYAYLLDLSNEMNEPLTANQKLNLPTDAKGKVTTRLELAKFEILNSISSLNDSDKFVIVVYEGITAKAVRKDGTWKRFSYGDNIELNADANTISTVKKTFDQFIAKDYGWNTYKILETQSNWISSFKSDVQYLKLYTSMSADVPMYDRKGDASENYNINNNIVVVDLSGSGNLRSWASQNNLSYYLR